MNQVGPPDDNSNVRKANTQNARAEGAIGTNIRGVRTLHFGGSPAVHRSGSCYFVYNAAEKASAPTLLYLLNHCLNSIGERFVFGLNSLLNDCGCTNPSSYAISLNGALVIRAAQCHFVLPDRCL